jgi:glycine oxidase
MKIKQTVAVIGAGVIGLSIGWQLARRGSRVMLFDSGDAGKQASWTAAGMLCPYTEAGFEEPELHDLHVRSLGMYPQFLDELQRDSGLPISLERTDTLMVALDSGDRRWLERIYKHKKALGFPVTGLSSAEVRSLEPLLSPRITAALLVKGEAQINNRLLIEALVQASQNVGVVLHAHHPVKEIVIKDGKAQAIKTAIGAEHAADSIVLSAGAWSGMFESMAMRPIKGQILSLKQCQTLNLMVRSPRCYLVSKNDGRLCLGATSEDVGFEEGCTVEGCWKLLDEARKILPIIEQAVVEETSYSYRPCTDDNMPIIGPSERVDRLYLACGHGRGGILLAPYTAYTIVDNIKRSFYASHL